MQSLDEGMITPLLAVALGLQKDNLLVTLDLNAQVDRYVIPRTGGKLRFEMNLKGMDGEKMLAAIIS